MARHRRFFFQPKHDSTSREAPCDGLCGKEWLCSSTVSHFHSHAGWVTQDYLDLAVWLTLFREMSRMSLPLPRRTASICYQ